MLGRSGLSAIAVAVLMSGAAFNPAAALFGASEQGVWYDPSDLSTVFQDSAGTTPGAVGQPVGKLLDKSGRGNHATQATGAARPILQQDANGKYYLSFDGVDDFLATGSISFTSTDKLTVWAGIHKLTDVGNQTVYETSAGADTNAGAFGLRAPSGGLSNVQGTIRGTSAINQITPSNTAPDLAVWTHQMDLAAAAGSAQFLRRNATATGTSTGTTGGGNFGNYPLYAGRRGGTSLPFNGRIYGLIVRGATSNAVQISKTERYLARKTGVTL